MAEGVTGLLRGTLSSSEAALRLGLSREKVVRLVQRRLLLAEVTAQGRYRIDEESVEELLAQARQPVTGG